MLFLEGLTLTQEKTVYFRRTMRPALMEWLQHRRVGFYMLSMLGTIVMAMFTSIRMEAVPGPKYATPSNNMAEIGVASFYTDASVDPRWGGHTKSGEMFDENLPTAAVLPSRWKELRGKKLKVTNVDTGLSVIVTVNDTGGFEKYGRTLDLSKSAFEAIGNPAKGLANVEYEVIEEEEKEK